MALPAAVVMVRPRVTPATVALAPSMALLLGPPQPEAAERPQKQAERRLHQGLQEHCHGNGEDDRRRQLCILRHLCFPSFSFSAKALPPRLRRELHALTDVGTLRLPCKKRTREAYTTDPKSTASRKSLVVQSSTAGATLSAAKS
eukprot:scaffold5442_cov223-Pinguiococcus_pyrenoidosus.AAC.3